MESVSSLPMSAEPARWLPPSPFQPALSEQAEPAPAAAELLAGVDGAPRQGFLLLATPAWSGGLAALREALGRELPSSALGAVIVDGLLAGGRERAGQRAAALLPVAALGSSEEGGDPAADLASGLPTPETGSGPGKGTGGQGGLALLFFDPIAADAERLARRLWEQRPGLALAGVGAAPGAPLVGETGHPATALAALLPAATPRLEATRACRRVTGFHRVTSARGHWVLRLDGRPALDVFRSAAAGRLAADPRRAVRHLVAILPAAGGEQVRELAGYCDRRRALCLGTPVARGERIGFGLRDPATALGDLRALLERASGLRGPGPRPAGLYLTCRARDAAFFGLEDLEAAYLDRAFPDLAVLGIRGPSPIAALGAAPSRLPHAGVLALLGPARDAARGPVECRQASG